MFKFDLNTFLKIRVNDEFLYLFNDFVGDYTTIVHTLTELLEHSKLDDSELDLDDISF